MPVIETNGSRQDRERLTTPVHHLDLNKESEQIRKEELWDTVGHTARTLVKQPDLRIVLTMMKAGTHIKEHQTAGRLSIHTLSGRIQIQLSDRKVDLPAGHLLVIEPAARHDVEAVEESAFLLTISWPQPGASPENRVGPPA